MTTTTAQELFDRMYLGLLEQGQKASDDGVRCKYRTETGLKCAVGMLIPDDEYKPDFEHWPIEEIPPIVDRYRPHLSLLEAVQTAHDQGRSFIFQGINDSYYTRGEDWLPAFKRRAKLVADHFGLEVPADGR